MAVVVQNVTAWRTRTLGELAQYVNGRAFKPAEWSATGVPIIRIQNLTTPHAEANRFEGKLDPRHRIEDGDVLVSWSASLDAFVWDRGTAALNQHIFKVQPRQDLIDREFLYYVLKAAMNQIRAAVHGSTMTHITKPKFEATTVRVPEDTAAQRRIASELKERLAEARRIEDAAGRQQEAVFACTGAVLRGALEVVHGSHVDEVPLGSVLERTQYGSSDLSNKEGRGARMIRMGNIVNGRLDLSDVVHVDLTPAEVAKYRLDPGDILINRTNSPELVGKSALFNEPEEYVFASYLIRLTPDPERCRADYLQAVLTSSVGRSYIDQKKHQSVGQANINATEIKAMPLPLPLVPEQEAVLKEIERAQPLIDQMSAAAEKAVEAAAALPDAILREVFEPSVALDEEPDDG